MLTESVVGFISLVSMVVLVGGISPIILSLLRSHGFQESTKKEFWLAVLALFTGGVAPVFLLLSAATVALSMGLLFGREAAAELREMMPALNAVSARYVPLVLLPSLAVLLWLLLYSFTRYPRLANRLLVGMGAGILATLGLDVVRLIGVRFGWLPFNMPPMFGLMILGPQADPAAGALVGYGYHFLNGADFGLIYVLTAGRVHWVWGVLWGVIIWLGMMVSPPMVIMGAGPFGLWTGGPAYLLTTLGAHLIYGAMLGLLAERYVREPAQLMMRWRMTEIEEELKREEEQVTYSQMEGGDV